MDQGQRRRRRVRERDVLRTMRKIEQTLSEAGTPIDRAHEVVAAIEDNKASRRGPKIKEPPAG